MKHSKVDEYHHFDSDSGHEEETWNAFVLQHWVVIDGLLGD